MRSEKEIRRVISLLRRCFAEACIAKDLVIMKTITAQIKALGWAAGDDDPMGFAGMLSELDAVEAAEKAAAN